MTTINATQGPGGAAAITNDSATSSVEVSGTILPDPIVMSGDPGAELAALAVQSGEEQETVAQAGRDAEQQMEVSEDNQQVADMRQKADDMRSAGVVEGVGMMAEGGASVGAAFVPTKIGMGLQGGGKLANGGATIGKTMFQASEANDDANAAAAKSASDQAKGAADDLHDAKKAGGDLISAALDFYREYTSAQASASSAALHRA
jgi:hypothetical protein